VKFAYAKCKEYLVNEVKKCYLLDIVPRGMQSDGIRSIRRRQGQTDESIWWNDAQRGETDYFGTWL
jgi:hypothetical protein